jgi:hypothetical protein
MRPEGVRQSRHLLANIRLHRQGRELRAVSHATEARMKRWTRSTARRRCGGCGADIPAEQPALSLNFGGPRSLIRCQACAKANFNETPPRFVDRPDEQPKQQPLGWTSAQELRQQLPTRGAVLGFARHGGRREGTS